MRTLKCKQCKREINVALGTFGYGMPEKCECGRADWVTITDGEWTAREDNVTMAEGS